MCVCILADRFTTMLADYKDFGAVGVASNRVFTEGTCKLLNLVISDLVDEDVVLHSRRQAISALMFGTVALLSKPGQTLAPLIGTWMLSVQTGQFCKLQTFQTSAKCCLVKSSLTDFRYFG